MTQDDKKLEDVLTGTFGDLVKRDARISDGVVRFTVTFPSGREAWLETATMCSRTIPRVMKKRIKLYYAGRCRTFDSEGKSYPKNIIRALEAIRRG